MVTGGVARGVHHDDRPVAAYVFVQGDGLNRTAVADPMRDQLRVHTGRRLGAGENVPVPFADEKCRLWQRVRLADVIAVVVTDAHVLHLVRGDLQLGEEIYQADLGSHLPGAHGLSGIPDHVVAAV